MSAATVNVDRLHKRYRSTVALHDVSFIAQGGVVALLGPNGAGKSTLLRCIATVLGADSGAVYVDGHDPRDPEARTMIRRRLGYLPQDPRFAPNARVVDVLDYFGIIKEIDGARLRHAEVARVLREVGLTDVARAKIKTLSGGMVRRVGIAQALLGDPGLVLLDEPAAGLDPEQRLLLRERLSRLGERATVIVSTHLTDEAAALSQVLYVLDRGRIAYGGTPASLAAQARGRVWRAADQPPPATGARLSWRTPDGWYRCVGDPPPGASLEPPTLEDAYLLLVGATGAASDAGAGAAWG